MSDSQSLELVFLCHMAAWRCSQMFSTWPHKLSKNDSCLKSIKVWTKPSTKSGVLLSQSGPEYHGPEKMFLLCALVRCLAWYVWGQVIYPLCVELWINMSIICHTVLELLCCHASHFVQPAIWGAHMSQKWKHKDFETEQRISLLLEPFWLHQVALNWDSGHCRGCTRHI